MSWSEFEIGTRTIARLSGLEDPDKALVAQDIEAVKFCGTCGENLIEVRGAGGYNFYTGLSFGVAWRHCSNGHETHLGWLEERPTPTHET